MTTGSPSIQSPPLKDRSVGLILFGVVQILLGCLLALMIPLMLLPLLAGAPPGVPTNMQTMIPACGFYGLSAAIFVTLGIGSICALRWARALTLVLAWMWLVMGGISLLVMWFVMPKVFSQIAAQQPIPPEVMIVMQVVMLGTTGCIYFVVPGAFVLFYQSPHVKATCEWKDPHVRWTDHCPLPVLALSLMLGLAVATMPLSLVYGRVMPLFGILLKGVPALLMILGMILLAGYLAWATYRLKMSAWWTTLAFYSILGVSAIVTFSRINMIDYYREINLPEEQVELIQKTGMLEGMNMPVIMGAGFVVFVGYLLWVRRYFVVAKRAAKQAEPAA